MQEKESKGPKEIPQWARTLYCVNKKIRVPILSTHIKFKWDHMHPEPQCLSQGQVDPESSLPGNLLKTADQVHWEALSRK